MAEAISEADRRLRQSCRVARVLRVLQLIQGRGRWDARTLAAELEVSERTIYRDVELLGLAGVPCWYDQGEARYRVVAGSGFPVLALTEEEAVGQATASVIAETPGLKPGTGARPATHKIAATSSATVQRILQEVGELVAVLDLKLADHTRHQDVIRTIRRALLTRKQISGRYRSPHEKGPVQLRLHPYRLCFIKQAWYVIGRPQEGEEPLTFRVPRFDPGVRILARAAEVPDDFDLRSYFGNAWAVFRGDVTHDVEIRFDREAAATVTETVWHHSQRAQRHRDGSLTLRFRVDGLNEIVRWVLGWAGRARVIRPRELRELVVARLQAGLELQRKP